MMMKIKAIMYENTHAQLSRVSPVFRSIYLILQLCFLPINRSWAYLSLAKYLGRAHISSVQEALQQHLRFAFPTNDSEPPVFLLSLTWLQKVTRAIPSYGGP